MAWWDDVTAEEDPRKRLGKVIEKMMTDAGTMGHPLSSTPPGMIYRAVKDGPAMMKGMWNTFTTPGDILAGKKKATVEDAAKFALDVGIGGGAFGTAPKGALRTFAGRNAKTADMAALAKAEAMEKAGVGRDEIWKSTGWGKGVDGKWRWEIDDSAAGFKRGTDELAMKRRDGLGESLNHEPLFAAYPEMTRTGFKPGYGGGSERGMYRPDVDEITINRASPEMFTGKRLKRDNALSITLHEMQHGAQAREGFATGASPDYIARELRMRDFDRVTKEYNKLMANNPDLASLARKRAEVVEPFYLKYGDGWKTRVSPTDYDRVLKINSEMARHPKFSEFAYLEGRLKSTPDVEGEAFAQYRRHAGEVEARNVQTRKDMNAAERRATPPWKTADTPEADQIVRFNGEPTIADRTEVMKYLRQRALEKFAAEGGT